MNVPTKYVRPASWIQCVGLKHRGATIFGSDSIAHGPVTALASFPHSHQRWMPRVDEIDDTWRHTRIWLKPNNPAFSPIELEESDEGAVQVIAELIEVLGTATPDR
ncbi:MAG: hypothetical protein IT481_08310 [Gammaproteobacteria bacterium]|nr:hypothetical protein [Gammaproteobacteria bacterium]